MFQTKINATALRQFQADFHGELICPGDKGYDSARKVWNGMIEKYPALIARCTDVSDVTKAIQFARRHSLPVAVRGGGHSFAGYGTCDDELFKLIIEAGSALPSPWTQVILQHVHGAASRVGPTETAFALRGEYYDLQLMTSWNEEMASRADAAIRWVRRLWEQTKPFAAEGTYINFLSGDEGASSVRASYGVNYERLVTLKNTYDPTNFFHLNHNIKPTIQQ